MKSIYIFFVVILLTISSCSMQRPYYETRNVENRGGGTVSMQYFYDALSPYGNWVHNREFGYVWIPNAGRNFYPYATNGRWVMTEYGWTWVSGYEWGWAPFHYGRWDYDNSYGWFWFPDDEWAPAWVNWRRSEGYYGWAPMGPGDSQGMGRMSNYDDPNRWVFVRDRDFAKSNIRTYNVNTGRNSEMLRSSQVIENGNSDKMGRRAYNSGPDPVEVQRSTGRRIDRIAVRDADRPGTRVNNNQLEIYRPRVQRSADVTNRPAPSRITDIKDIRPTTREKDRNYQPGSTQGEMRQYQPATNQGRREEATPEQRAREVQRQYEVKQDSMSRRQQQVGESQQQRSREVQARPAERRRAERIQQTDQQKRIIKKERETGRQVQADSTQTRKVQREAVSQPRRR